MEFPYKKGMIIHWMICLHFNVEKHRVVVAVQVGLHSTSSQNRLENTHQCVVTQWTQQLCKQMGFNHPAPSNVFKDHLR